MKSTHRKLVEIHEQMGYEIADEYPSLQIVVMVRNGKFKTIRKQSWVNGRYNPNTGGIDK